MHIIRNASADITTPWYDASQLPGGPGEHTLSCNGTSFGGGTAKLQFGKEGIDGTVIALTDDPDMAFTASAKSVIVTVSPNMKFRGVLSGSTSPSGVNLWLS